MLLRCMRFIYFTHIILSQYRSPNRSESMEKTRAQEFHAIFILNSKFNLKYSRTIIVFVPFSHVSTGTFQAIEREKDKKYIYCSRLWHRITQCDLNIRASQTTNQTFIYLVFLFMHYCECICHWYRCIGSVAQLITTHCVRLPHVSV